MQPLFNGPSDLKPRRNINLGGASSSSSHNDILQTAKAHRAERQALKQQRDAATLIQAQWRGSLDRERTKMGIRAKFDEDLSSLDAMRCLILLGNDEERLERWVDATAEMGEASLLRYATGPEKTSWLVLVKRIARVLLQVVAEHPMRADSLKYLRFLTVLLSISIVEETLPQQGRAICEDIAGYLISNDYYPLIRNAVVGIPVEQKSSPTLPMLTALMTVPLDVLSRTPEKRQSCVQLIFTHILTIPLLPNRLPITSLTQFSAKLPLRDVHVIKPNVETFAISLPQEHRLHLLANLMVFAPSRYSTFAPETLEIYLLLLASLLDALPVDIFEASSEKSMSTTWLQGSRDDEDDSSSEDDVERVGETSDPSRKSAQRAHFLSQPSPFTTSKLDPKTRSRMQTLINQNHMASLLQASSRHQPARNQLFRFVLSLCRAWPAQSEKAIHAVSVSTGSGFMREIYRGYVRGSPLGKSDDLISLNDTKHAQHWPSLLIFTYLYNRALLTMGDEEFFSSSSSSSSFATASQQRNPLTLDELVEFSRQLMNIAYILYLGDGAVKLLDKEVPGAGLTWRSVRELATLCLQGIHARDSRRPFTPPDHWSCSERISQMIMMSYEAYDADFLEDQEPSQTALNAPVSTFVSPRVQADVRTAIVLKSIPFAIPFEKRVNIFRRLIERDRRQNYMSVRDIDSPRLVVSIRRDHVAADGFDKLGQVNLKMPFRVRFMDQFGEEEMGIDGGGLFKEFFTSLSKEVFQADRGLWVTNTKNEVYPSPLSYAKERHQLDWYRFIGRIVGKALYEGILIDVPFAGFFLAKWLKKQSYLDDLESLDPQLYKGLLFVKHHPENLDELSLTFSIAEEEFGVAKSIDLIPNGSNVPVTASNRLQYITLVCYHRLTRQIRPQSDAFFEGLSEIIDPKWLRMFNQQELQVLIGGVDTAIDVEELRQNTVYGGLYDGEHKTILMFWEVLRGFDQTQKKAFLRFVTSCSRPPLLGFQELYPKFSIRDAGTDQQRLPSSSTCVNLLKLPLYTSVHTLREKLLKAINSGAGFYLS